MSIKLMILTADPLFAIEAEQAGIDRIFYDLEYINKRERQAGRNTVLSENKVDGIAAVKEVLTTAELLVRVNPIHQYSKMEIDESIKHGADILMLPMVLDANDVKQFVEIVDGRAKTCVMIETTQSMTRINSILEQKGVDEIFIGLNDLHIGLGLKFMFEILGGGLVEYMASRCNARGIPFGFGGIARIGDGTLPAEMILGEHIRLCSSSVILSRTFKGEVGDAKKVAIASEVEKVRACIADISTWDDTKCIENKHNLERIVSKIVNP